MKKSADYLIEVNDLCKHYKDFHLENITFNLARGSIMGLIGPNGAGKTTIIKSLLGMVLPDSGSMRLLGHNLSNSSSRSMQKIGIVMDTPFFVGDWTLVDVEKAMKTFRHCWDGTVFRALLEKFKLDKSKKVNDLSRGMEMRLMVATALSYDTELLILDEPTSGLDPVARNDLMEVLEEYVKDKSKGILFSTHITSDLEKIADHITFVNNGKLLYTGTKIDMLNHYSDKVLCRATDIDEIIIHMSKQGGSGNV